MMRPLGSTMQPASAGMSAAGSNHSRGGYSGMLGFNAAVMPDMLPSTRTPVASVPYTQGRSALARAGRTRLTVEPARGTIRTVVEGGEISGRLVVDADTAPSESANALGDAGNIVRPEPRRRSAVVDHRHVDVRR